MSDPLHKQTTRSYNQQADEYDQKWEKYLRHTHQTLIHALDIKEDGTLCDISCGTGLFTYELLKRYPGLKLIQLNDPADAMISTANERFKAISQVQYSGFHVHEIDQANHKFDTLICLNAFHNYHNQQECLDACYRALHPGGKLYILDWNKTGMFRLINQLIRLWVPELINSRSAYEVYEMLYASGFELTHIRSWGWRYWKFFLIEAEKPSA